MITLMKKITRVTNSKFVVQYSVEYLGWGLRIRITQVEMWEGLMILLKPICFCRIYNRVAAELTNQSIRFQ